VGERLRELPIFLKKGRDLVVPLYHATSGMVEWLRDATNEVAFDWLFIEHFQLVSKFEFNKDGLNA
jgi:hypothetical protein